KTTLRPGKDKAAFVTFDHVFELKQDYTDDPIILTKAISRTLAGGGTRLYDALYFVIQNKLDTPEQRKAIILITDGDDRSSRHSPEEVLELAQRFNVSIYAISMNALGMRPAAAADGDAVLDMLTKETGGISMFPTRIEKLSSNFERIAS